MIRTEWAEQTTYLRANHSPLLVRSQEWVRPYAVRKWL